MIYLAAASLLWAFSFGLIKGQLAGIDPVAVSCARMFLAAVAFSPLLFRRTVPRRLIGPAMALGAIQFGLMYVLYIASFKWLPAWKVALFTVFTPFFVIWISDLRDRRFTPRAVLAALLAVTGAMWVQSGTLGPDGDSAWNWSGWFAQGQWRGILLLQGANLSFAFGQVFFGGLVRKTNGQEASLLAWMYQGAFLVTAMALTLREGTGLGDWSAASLWVVLYLGLVPTALGFYLWNKGASNVRSGLLAVANNLITGERTAY